MSGGGQTEIVELTAAELLEVWSERTEKALAGVERTARQLAG